MLIPNQSNATFNAVIPNEGTIAGQLASNIVNTEILSYAISKVISSDKTWVQEGEICNNKVTITNNSTTELTYTFISNPTPNGATYVDGSVKVNGVAEPNRNMINGFYLPNMKPGETLTIEYDMKIDKPMTANPVVDTSEFQYTVNDPARGNVSYREYTNEISFNVISSKLSVVKNVDKTFATKGETLTYTITFTNNGNVDIDDIYFTDNIPAGTTFVENSVMLNGTNVPEYRPEDGYVVTKLTPNQSCTTSFKVTVD
ncbi:MAG: DUF11 domain-containing protein [Clostridia bacterium]|nr:DUF11 domain-containing protein [Clostridia bacterium]